MYFFLRLARSILLVSLIISGNALVCSAQNSIEELSEPQDVMVRYYQNNVEVVWEDVICVECGPNPNIKYVIKLNTNPNDSEPREGLSPQLTSPEYQIALNEFQLGLNLDKQAVVDSGLGKRIFENHSLNTDIIVTVWAYYIDHDMAEFSSKGVIKTILAPKAQKSKSWIAAPIVLGSVVGIVLTSYGVKKLINRYRNRHNVENDGSENELDDEAKEEDTVSHDDETADNGNSYNENDNFNSDGETADNGNSYNENDNFNSDGEPADGGYTNFYEDEENSFNGVAENHSEFSESNREYINMRRDQILSHHNSLDGNDVRFKRAQVLELTNSSECD